MTLSTEIIFPLNEERLNSGDSNQIGAYVRELVTTLTTMYQQISQATNGDIRQYLPLVYGNTSQGEAVYTTQDGWYLRKGIIVDYWFAVGWSAHSGTGQIYIQLPYKVKQVIGAVFNSSVHGQYNYGGGYTSLFGIAISDTIKYLLYAEGPANIAIAPLALLTSGALIGHIRYIGQELEK